MTSYRPSRTASSRWPLMDVIEGYYLGCVLDFLHREGILDALAAGEDPRSVAQARSFDPKRLESLLEYASSCCDILEQCGEGGEPSRFVVSKSYSHGQLLGHLLDQYIGGYGTCLRHLDAVLRHPLAGQRLVDLERHAKAFSRSKGASVPEMVGLIEGLEIDYLLDLGCGAGQLLTHLAQRNPGFRGVGVEASQIVAGLAHKRIADLKLEERIEIIDCEVGDLERFLSDERRSAVQALSAVSVANAHFGRDGKIDDFLRSLRRLFPERIVLFSDYYGRLGTYVSDTRAYQRTLVHDVAQLASGQGVPPSSLEEWRQIYDRTSCALVDAFDGHNGGIAWYIHVVQL